MDKDILTLPTQATGRVDVGRLLHEAEQIDNFLKQAAIRQPGTAVNMPKASRLMDEFLVSNKLNLLQEPDRQRVLKFLAMVKAKAPVLHVSFGVDPSPIFTQKLITWLRAEIHPLVLMQVGLQPNIGAGCVVRSTNKYYDLSLRQHFKKQRPLLLAKLQGASTTPSATKTTQQEKPEPAHAMKEVEYALSPQQPVPSSPSAQEVTHE